MITLTLDTPFAVRTLRWAVAERKQEQRPAVRDALVARIPDEASVLVLALSSEETEHLLGVLYDFGHALWEWRVSQDMDAQTRDVIDEQIPLIRELMGRLAEDYSRVDRPAAQRIITRLLGQPAPAKDPT